MQIDIPQRHVILVLRTIELIGSQQVAKGEFGVRHRELEVGNLSLMIIHQCFKCQFIYT